jgi:ADP-ribose pyrophosphatase
VKPWKTVSRKTVQQYGKFLTLEVHEIELPDGRIIKNWPWLVAPDFVLVLARTTDGKYLCFRQTKYAVKGVTLAPVGGHVDDGEPPLAAAKRELHEETGHIASRWIHLGSFATHANRGGGRGHFYLALDARPHCAPHSDDLEEQELLFLSRQQLERALDRHDFKVLAWSTVVALAIRYLDNKEKPSCSKPASSTRKSTRS